MKAKTCFDPTLEFFYFFCQPQATNTPKQNRVWLKNGRTDGSGRMFRPQHNSNEFELNLYWMNSGKFCGIGQTDGKWMESGWKVDGEWMETGQKAKGTKKQHKTQSGEVRLPDSKPICSARQLQHRIKHTTQHRSNLLSELLEVTLGDKLGGVRSFSCVTWIGTTGKKRSLLGVFPLDDLKRTYSIRL